MTKKIWKYEFPVKTKFTIEVPEYAKVLSVQTQNGKPCIWVMVDDKYIEKLVEREFYVIPTGVPFDDKEISYIGTYQQGAFVYHLFEKVSIGAKIAELL